MPDRCEQVGDQLPGLVLGDLDGEERAAVVAHLEHCPACREEASSLVEAVDALSEAVPPASLSDDFVGVTVARMAGQPPLATNARRSPTRLPRLCRRGRLFAAALALALVGLAGGGLAWGLTRHQPNHESGRVAAVSLRAVNGQTIGEAVAFTRPRPVLSVTLDLPGSGAALAGDGAYQVWLTDAAGRRARLGLVPVHDGRGAAALGIPPPLTGPIGDVSVRAPGGVDVCAGHLPLTTQATPPPIQPSGG